MKTIVILLLLLPAIGLTAGADPLFPVTAARPPSPPISGHCTIQDGGSPKPCHRERLKASTAASDTVVEFVTGDDGAFSFTVSDDQDYWIESRHAGYQVKPESIVYAGHNGDVALVPDERMDLLKDPAPGPKDSVDSHGYHHVLSGDSRYSHTAQSIFPVTPLIVHSGMPEIYYSTPVMSAPNPWSKLRAMQDLSTTGRPREDPGTHIPGYEIVSLEHGGFLEAFGVKRGDLLLGFGGAMLESPPGEKGTSKAIPLHIQSPRAIFVRGMPLEIFVKRGRKYFRIRPSSEASPPPAGGKANP